MFLIILYLYNLCVYILFNNPFIILVAFWIQIFSIEKEQDAQNKYSSRSLWIRICITTQSLISAMSCVCLIQGDTQMERDVLSEINQNNMSRYQWFVILICICLNIIDGFDVMVMAFTAPSVSAEWSLSGAQIGLLLSSGLLGWLPVPFFLHL